MRTGTPIGWRIPFSARKKNERLAHLLVTTRHQGLAFRACLPGQVVNIGLARRQSVSDHRCTTCSAIEAKQQVRAAA